MLHSYSIVHYTVVPLHFYTTTLQCTTLLYRHIIVHYTAVSCVRADCGTAVASEQYTAVLRQGCSSILLHCARAAAVYCCTVLLLQTPYCTIPPLLLRQLQPQNSAAVLCCTGSPAVVLYCTGSPAVVQWCSSAVLPVQQCSVQ